MSGDTNHHVRIRTPRRYVCEVTSEGVQATVNEEELHGVSSRPLNPDDSDRGFQWGYEGSGPRNLAYAILRDLIAERFHEAFMKEVIATTPTCSAPHPAVTNPGRIIVFYEEAILNWLRKKLGEIEFVQPMPGSEWDREQKQWDYGR